jgi:hypothetical protein
MKTRLIVGLSFLILISQSLLTDKFIIPDDYPITNEMLRKYYKEDTHSVFSISEIWFKNNTSHEMLIFGLYTDFFRVSMYHCKSEFLLSYLIKHLEYYDGTSTKTHDESKDENFIKLYNSSNEIDQQYFKTKQGLVLGISKAEAISKYGVPNSESRQDNYEILRWNFKGDGFSTDTIIKSNEKIAKNSFGYHVTMYFTKGELVCLILKNVIP